MILEKQNISDEEMISIPTFSQDSSDNNEIRDQEDIL